MSKNSNKKTYKQLMSWLSNELYFGKGQKKVKRKKGNIQSPFNKNKKHLHKNKSLNTN